MDDVKIDGVKIAVLYGAAGAEREVSIESGKAIAAALKAGGADVIECDYKIEDESILDDESVDVYFLAFHGEFGEGGAMQMICEGRGIVFTGCDSKASELAFDKIASKRAFLASGIAVPRGLYIEKKKDLLSAAKRLSGKGGKFIVKPARQGSSVGIKVAETSGDAAEAAKICFAEFGPCLIEQFIDGREFAVSIVGGLTLPIIEIKTVHQFYDYDAKYVDDTTKFAFGSIDDEALINKINVLAMKSFDCLGCRDFGRVDFLVDSAGEVYVTEINTIPGFTSHSLLPKAAAKAGADMPTLCSRIVEMAFNRNNK
ncbi:MAG: D-alanine--D-alanine ligase [Anaerohalosphaeraceae bacterium]|nr:D-alanine--D-alanine ligase [Anaerohalosphaeraceae bacterium]